MPLMYARTLGFVYDLKNMDTFGDLLLERLACGPRRRVSRSDGRSAPAAHTGLHPGPDEPAASDDNAAVERAAVAMLSRLDTNWASDDPTDAEVADWWGEACSKAEMELYRQLVSGL